MSITQRYDLIYTPDLRCPASFDIEHECSPFFDSRRLDTFAMDEMYNDILKTCQPTDMRCICRSHLSAGINPLSLLPIDLDPFGCP